MGFNLYIFYGCLSILLLFLWCSYHICGTQTKNATDFFIEMGREIKFEPNDPYKKLYDELTDFRSTRRETFILMRDFSNQEFTKFCVLRENISKWIYGDEIDLMMISQKCFPKTYNEDAGFLDYLQNKKINIRKKHWHWYKFKKSNLEDNYSKIPKLKNMVFNIEIDVFYVNEVITGVWNFLKEQLKYNEHQPVVEKNIFILISNASIKLLSIKGPSEGLPNGIETILVTDKEISRKAFDIFIYNGKEIDHGLFYHKDYHKLRFSIYEKEWDASYTTVFTDIFFRMLQCLNGPGYSPGMRRKF